MAGTWKWPFSKNKQGKRLMKAKWIFMPLFIVVALLLAVGMSLADPGRSIGVVRVKIPGGKAMDLYAQSFALLVGVSDYTADWPDLEQVPAEMKKVQTALQRQGF